MPSGLHSREPARGASRGIGRPSVRGTPLKLAPDRRSIEPGGSLHFREALAGPKLVGIQFDGFPIGVVGQVGPCPLLLGLADLAIQPGSMLGVYRRSGHHPQCIAIRPVDNVNTGDVRAIGVGATWRRAEVSTIARACSPEVGWPRDQRTQSDVDCERLPRPLERSDRRPHISGKRQRTLTTACTRLPGKAKYRPKSTANVCRGPSSPLTDASAENVRTLSRRHVGDTTGFQRPSACRPEAPRARTELHDASTGAVRSIADLDRNTSEDVPKVP